MDFRKLIRAERTTTLHKLGWKNAGKAVRKADILQILDIFNRLFFFGALRLQFKWEVGLTGPGGGAAYGQCCPPNSCASSLIQMDAVCINTNIQGLAGHSGPTLSRLGTLLHEVLHAYFFQYACRRCAMWGTNIGDGGHGRAYQMTASRLEEVTERLFGGMRLSVGAGRGFKGDWRYLSVLPSRCDLGCGNGRFLSMGRE